MKPGKQAQKTSTPDGRRFINEADLAALTGISKRTWQKHRLFGRGPRFYRICGAVRYDLSEVLEWIKAHGIGPFE